MTLEGNLRDFGLEAIFQLINSGKKTGTLHIVRNNGEAEAFIYFRKGRIFGAVSNYNRQPIGERLVNAGHLSEAQLKQALDIQRNSAHRERIGQILIKQGWVTEDILKAFVKEQLQNTVFDILPWTDGEFEFFADELPAIEDMGLLVSAKRFFVKGRQRLDKWDKIREKVPSAAAVFQVVPDINARLKQAQLPTGHMRLLQMIDGERDVTKLAFAAQVSEYEISTILHDLATKGLIELAGTAVEVLAEPQAVEEVAEPAEEAEERIEQPVETEADFAEVVEQEDEEEDEALGDHFDLTPDEVISGRASYVGELLALTDSRRSGTRSKFSLPATSAAVLAERIHLDRDTDKEKIEAIIKWLKK